MSAARLRRDESVLTQKAKVCLVGEEAVGKTSLIRRFVTGGFATEYMRTLGTLLSKKSVELETEIGQVRVELMIWDIVGKREFAQLVGDAYFFGANGLIGVVDSTRRVTMQQLGAWIEAARMEVGQLPILVFANKWDLAEERQIGEEDLRIFGAKKRVEVLPSSAKTGENVQEGFLRLARALASRVSAPGAAP